MTILLKKHMKQELSCKERKLKSIRAGKVNLKDSYARIHNGEGISDRDAY